MRVTLALLMGAIVLAGCGLSGVFAASGGGALTQNFDAQPAPAPAPSAPTPSSDCESLAHAVRTCRPMRCASPHPVDQSYMIEHRVRGTEGSICVYHQSVPGDMRMNCRLSMAGRAEVAQHLQALLDGSGAQTIATPAANQSVFTRECALRDRRGLVLPWNRD